MVSITENDLLLNFRGFWYSKAKLFKKQSKGTGTYINNLKSLRRFRDLSKVLMSNKRLEINVGYNLVVEHSIAYREGDSGLWLSSSGSGVRKTYISIRFLIIFGFCVFMTFTCYLYK